MMFWVSIFDGSSVNAITLSSKTKEQGVSTMLKGEFSSLRYITQSPILAGGPEGNLWGSLKASGPQAISFPIREEYWPCIWCSVDLSIFLPPPRSISSDSRQVLINTWYVVGQITLWPTSFKISSLTSYLVHTLVFLCIKSGIILLL